MLYKNTFHTENLSQYTFLVTGGAGFIGSNIVEYLLNYNAGKVKVLDNFSTGLRQNIDDFINKPNFEIIEDDITNINACRKACEDVDYVIHQAALGSVPRSIKDPITTNLNNVNGFLNMLIAAREAKVKRFVYASSSSVYGDSNILPKKEEYTGKPLSPYAVSKITNELYANVFYKNYGIEVIGLRYFNVFGPRQNPKGPYAAVIPLFFEKILKNLPPQIDGDGEQTRDFTFIENAVQANIKAIFCKNKNAVGNVFNIAFGSATSINKLFEMICSIANKQIKAEHRAARLGDIRQSLADINKACEILDYKPLIDVKEGLKISFEWYKNNILNFN
ncbi:MAG TPA: SDR family oxidoreductase [Bacteroidales bacterium]|nr:SDR family oxidoreductase [Bacteroidales bacterium]